MFSLVRYITKCFAFRKFTECSVLLLDETTGDGSETTIPPNASMYTYVITLTLCVVVLGVDVDK